MMLRFAQFAKRTINTLEINVEVFVIPISIHLI